MSHEDERDAGYVFKIIVVGLYLAFHLKCVGYFGSDANNDDQFFNKTNVAVVTVVALILRHVQSCSCNGYEISELVRNQKAIMVTIPSLEVMGLNSTRTETCNGSAKRLQ